MIANITDRNITSDFAIRSLKKALESQPSIKDGEFCILVKVHRIRQKYLLNIESTQM